ncbi:phosphatidylglycerol lysyltransferase domain-containing protein, partial [Staphylococcus epidermidis]|uniref:phosphatidylglycerol lysyltransferase domain-containing protein n=1 Tax=Staphylococcus epidermidis TaxID=1282 RepID=UPI0011A30714
LTLCHPIIQKYAGNYLSHLVYTRHKHSFFNQNKHSFIIYPYNSNPLLLFPHPIRNTKSFQSLLQPFYHFPHYQPYHIIFYQITHQYIPLYHNFPNQFFKL